MEFNGVLMKTKTDMLSEDLTLTDEDLCNEHGSKAWICNYYTL